MRQNLAKETQASIVRLASKEDAAQIAELYTTSFPEHIMVQRGFLSDPQYIAGRLDNSDEVWAVEQNGVIRGVAALALVPPVGLGEIERVCVGLEHRGEHIAESLCSWLVQEARDKELGFVEAFARGDQPAMQRTFERLGFQVYGVSPRFEVVHDGSTVREQFVHMGLELLPETIDERTMVLIPEARRIYNSVHK